MHSNRKYNQVIKNLSRSMTALEDRDHYYDDVPHDAPLPEPPGSPSPDVHRNLSYRSQTYVNINRREKNPPNYSVPDKQRSRYLNEQEAPGPIDDVGNEKKENYDTFDPNSCPRHAPTTPTSEITRKLPNCSTLPQCMTSNPWRVAAIVMLALIVVLLGLLLFYALNGAEGDQQSARIGSSPELNEATTALIPRLIP